MDVPWVLGEDGVVRSCSEVDMWVYDVENDKDDDSDWEWYVGVWEKVEEPESAVVVDIISVCLDVSNVDECVLSDQLVGSNGLAVVVTVFLEECPLR